MTTKAKKAPAVSWVTKPRQAAIEVLRNMAAEASDWHWSFGDLMLVLIPIGKDDRPVRYVDADGHGKRFPTLKAAYGSLKRHTDLVVNYDLALTLRSTAAAWPKADRPDPALMSIYACQRLNGRRADLGAAGRADMAAWIDDALKADGRVTVKDAERRSADTNPSPIVKVPKASKVVDDRVQPPEADLSKPFTGDTAWSDFADACEVLARRIPRRALPDDGTDVRVIGAVSRIRNAVPSALPTDLVPSGASN
jgi:hypothetical protein